MASSHLRFLLHLPPLQTNADDIRIFYPDHAAQPLLLEFHLHPAIASFCPNFIPRLPSQKSCEDRSCGKSRYRSLHQPRLPPHPRVLCLKASNSTMVVDTEPKDQVSHREDCYRGLLHRSVGVSDYSVLAAKTEVRLLAVRDLRLAVSSLEAIEGRPAASSLSQAKRSGVCPWSPPLADIRR